MRNLYYIILFCLGVSQAFSWVDPNWVGFSLLIVAGIPFWVPILARYIKTLRKSGKNWELELRENIIGLPSEKVDEMLATESAGEGGTTESALVTSTSFDDFSIHARRVLTALWFYQCEIFGENSQRRWGFGLGRHVPDFSGFEIGVNELGWDKLIFTDSQGLAYLTNQGLEFCKGERSKVEAEEAYYNTFEGKPQKKRKR